MPGLLILKSYWGIFSITRSLNGIDSSFRQAAAWSPWRDVTILSSALVLYVSKLPLGACSIRASWAKRQLPRASLRLWYEPRHEISNIHAVWSKPFLVAWIFYECYATDWTSFWVSKLKRRLHRLVWVWADPQGASVCNVFLFFCQFPIRCSGSGVIQIVSIPDICVLPYFLYSHEYRLTRNTVYCAILSDQIVTPRERKWLDSCEWTAKYSTCDVVHYKIQDTRNFI